MEGRVIAILGIIQTDIDGLSRNINPFIRSPGPESLASHALKVWLHRVRRWQGLGALQHHVKQSLKVHNLMLKPEPDGSADGPRNGICASRVEADEPGTDSVLVGHDVVHRRPLVGNLGVIMALVGVVDIRVDATLEDGIVRSRMGGLVTGSLGELDVEERGDMAQVEDAGVSQLDGLFGQFLLGQHSSRDGVPGRPERLPVIDRGEDSRSVQGRLQREWHFGSAELVDTCVSC